MIEYFPGEKRRAGTPVKSGNRKKAWPDRPPAGAFGADVRVRDRARMSGGSGPKAAGRGHNRRGASPGCGRGTTAPGDTAGSGAGGGTNNTEYADPPAPGRAGARKQTVSTKPFPWLAGIGAFLAAAALPLGFSAPAHAETLVSNTGRSTHGYTACVSVSELLDCAQGFTTGQNTRGYDLTSIQLDTQRAPGSVRWPRLAKIPNPL